MTKNSNWQDSARTIYEDFSPRGTKVRIVEYLSPYDPSSKFGVEFFLGKEWNTFGGSVGYSDSLFKTLDLALNYFLEGFEKELKNEEIWLDLIAIPIMPTQN